MHQASYSVPEGVLRRSQVLSIRVRELSSMEKEDPLATILTVAHPHSHNCKKGTNVGQCRLDRGHIALLQGDQIEMHQRHLLRKELRRRQWSQGRA